MDGKSVERRNNETGKSDKQLAGDYIQTVEDEFPDGKGLDYLIIDACFDDDDADEKIAFERALESLWVKIRNAKKLQTDKVRKVASEKKKLEREIKKMEQAWKEEMNNFKLLTCGHSTKYFYLQCISSMNTNTNVFLNND